MVTGLRNVLSKWWGKADNSPGLPTYVSTAPSQPVGPSVVVVVTSSPAAASQDEAPASVAIDIGTLAMRQPTPPSPKLHGRVIVEPILPTYHTGVASVQLSSPAGSPATHSALRRSDTQKILKEPSEQECLAKLQELEKDRPSGLRDAERAYCKIWLAKRATDPIQVRLRLTEARQYLDSAQKITQENTFCPPSVLQDWAHKISENQSFLNRVAAELSISLDPALPSALPVPALTPPSQAPEKSSSSPFSITYIVVVIITLLGVVLVTKGALYRYRLWRKA